MPLTISYKCAQRGPCMTLFFTLKNKFSGDLPVAEIGQGQFNIDDLVEFRLQFDQRTPTNSTTGPLPVFINMSTRKHEKGRNLKVKLKVTCPKIGISKKNFCAVSWSDWIELGSDKLSYDETMYRLDNLEIILAVSTYGAVTFADLYDDTDIIDFNLTLEDASVPVHKACLAAHSNKFKTLFTTVWKDITDGRIQVKGVTKRTLEYLKDYMYLGRLPDVDIRPMLLFALHYSMKNLKEDCITKLVETVEFYSLYDLLEFACENNIPELTFALMVQVSDVIVHNAYELKKNKRVLKDERFEHQ